MLNQGIESIKSVLETSQDLDKKGYFAKQPEPIETLLSESLQQCTTLLQHVTLVIRLKNMTGYQVLCDKKMLDQVFVNLIRNAVESINEKTKDHKGKILITAEFRDTNVFILKFNDNGAGISNEIKQKLFKFKFTTKKDGMGIGLHLAKMILKIHNGDIKVESQLGKGSTVSIYLPLFYS